MQLSLTVLLGCTRRHLGRRRRQVLRIERRQALLLLGEVGLAEPRHHDRVDPARDVEGPSVAQQTLEGG